MPKKKKETEEATQPEINIGLCGHVDHGKTTLLERLSGKWTDTHSEEIKRGITIRLGYADTVLRKCTKCRGTKAYTVQEECPHCKSPAKILRKISFVDAPGHESLMATMLSGAAIIDAALLLIAANESCPQPQTREHLMALEVTGIKNVIIVQNKIDLVGEEDAIKNHKQIKEFIKKTPYKDVPIMPLSAQHSVGVSNLIQAIEENFPTPKRDPKKDPLMFVARSFDINKPGALTEELVGGVLGGSLKQGILKVKENIEIRPGRKIIEKNQEVWNPIFTKITALKSGGTSLKELGPGGSIGILTSLDPAIVKSDQLTGSIVGLPGTLPEVWHELNLEVHLLERVVGTKDELNVEPIKINEPLMLNVNSAATMGIVGELKKNRVRCKLKLPICAEIGSKVTISRIVDNRFRLIGYGEIKEK
ncbi:translation initiation factor IF-2 subunit gamma [Candidatus Woesearchaeota archaeon]|nr:translation initiation factor IF-2 subunit gamma [Candidatus Woesearchaeota archaeon]